ncbi:nucleoid-associated protein [Rouxiella sp. WC2420]|uniref:Nucleoid-associated protein n=1 Tax=Rouxiella sp. WC2420 TaxID=3234145 RepID=A0AB39VTH0_9GAMM
MSKHYSSENFNYVSSELGVIKTKNKFLFHKDSRMSFKLRHCVIHDLIKESGKQAVETKIKTKVLPNNDIYVQTLIEELYGLIGKKESQAARGTFDSNIDVYKVPAAFNKYYESNSTSEDFISFSKTCMNELSKQAKDPHRIAASGGAIVFSHFEVKGSNYFLVTMIKQKDALGLNDDLIPVRTVEIDLSKIHQAARINYDRYFNHITSQDEDKPNYLAFVSPKSNIDASGYFVSALGCSDSLPPSKATELALTGVRQFFEANVDLKPFKQPAYEAVFTYLKEKANGETASINDIEHVVRGIVPPKLGDVINNLSEFLNSDDIGLPNEFGVSQATLTRRSRVRTKSDGWELVFEKRVLGTRDGADIRYVKAENKIIISNLDDDTKAKIEKALEEKNG